MDREQRERMQSWLGYEATRYDTNGSLARSYGYPGSHAAMRASDIRDVEALLSDESELHRRIGEAVMGAGLSIDDCEAVATVYGWAGNGSAPRIVATMRAVQRALREAGR